MKIVMHHHDASEACVALIDESARLWREAEGNYRDDITAIVVHAPFFPSEPLPLNGAADSSSSVTGSVAVEPQVRRGSSTEVLSQATGGEYSSAPGASTPSVPDGASLKRRLTVQGDLVEGAEADARLKELQQQHAGVLGSS